MGEFAGSGGLDPVPADLLDAGAFFEGPWNTVVVDGTPYGVPWYTETRVLYYRKDLADKAGVQAPTTWDELKPFAKAMQDTGGAKHGIYMQPADPGTWQTLAPFVWQAGGNMVNDPANPTEYTFDTEQWRQALEFQKAFYDDKLSQATPLQPGEIESKFAKGELGSFFSGPWHVGLVKDQGVKDEQLGLAVMPKDQTGTSFVGGGNLAVFKDAKNRDGAWKFVQWLSRPEVQQRWYDTTKDLPATRAAWEGGSLASDPNLEVFSASSSRTPRRRRRWPPGSRSPRSSTARPRRSSRAPARPRTPPRRSRARPRPSAWGTDMAAVPAPVREGGGGTRGVRGTAGVVPR
jgi:multiple sugar transport system substrate-binding protein